MFKSIAVLIYMILFSAEALGSDAYVYAEEEFGQGFFRARGTECFFITAGHVVEDATEIELVTSGRNRYEATVITTYPDDLAILRVEIPKNTTCPKSSWDSGKKLKTLLSMEQEGIVKTRLDDGSILQTTVSIKTFDAFRFIRITPKNPNDQFLKGFSGSPLFIAGKLAGMLQSVSNGVGNVFRQDALNNTVSLFFGAEEINKKTLQIPSEMLDVTSKFVNEKTSLPPISFKGSITEEQSVEHQFKGTANSPLLITNEKTSGGFSYYLEILKGKKVVYGAGHGSSKKTEHIFTPKKDGTYIIKLSGKGYHGEYNLIMEQITTNAELTGKANVIAVGETIEGKLANGAIAEYRFIGTANSPLLITNEKTSGGFSYYLEILKGKKVVYGAGHGSSKKTEHIFTPKKDGTYIIKLSGKGYHGEYNLIME